jgi:hypothetical protein
MDEVYVGSQEQVRGIGEMAQAISQMERVTQSSAASAEEGAAAAAELNNQSEGVVRVVNDLTALVGGAAGPVQKSRPESGAPAPQPRKESRAGLPTLEKAVSHRAKAPKPRTVPAGRQATEKAFPMDENDFQEF